MANPALATDVLRMTREEYLAFEETAEEKHEWYKNGAFAMSGGTRNHAVVIGNVLAALHRALRGTGCILFQGDMRVQVQAAGLYTYPDLSVVCGEEEYETEKQTTLLNPTLIVEVLSESTERYDRGRKFAFYRQLASLQEYVLIAQDRASMEVFRKGADGHWTLFEPDDKGRIELASVSAALRLADVYENVDLTDDDTQPGRLPSNGS